MKRLPGSSSRPGLRGRSDASHAVIPGQRTSWASQSIPVGIDGRGRPLAGAASTA